MNSFFKLLNFELNRFMKLYIALLITIAVIQLIGTFVAAQKYMILVNNSFIKGGMNEKAFIEMYSTFSLIDNAYSLWVLGPLAIGIALLIIYIFFIWYRDWFAKNTFIYRLLMLPTSRMNVFFAKAVTIMLTMLGLIGMQIVLLYLEEKMVKWIVPKVFRIDLTVPEVISGVYQLSMILPESFMEFLVTYSLVFAFIVVMFTAILFERSFKFKGIAIGILYIFCSISLFILPVIVQFLLFGNLYLYPDELFFVEFFIWMVVVACSLLVSRYLLNRKVTV